MVDPQIDPRLFQPTSVPPQGQSYTQAPPQNGSHPYYVSAHQQPPQLQTAPLGALDPALDQTSPTGPASQDEDEHDDEHEHEEDGDHDAHATPGSAKSPGDIKRPRACDSCRGLKVRCDQERPDVSCKRCAKAGRACITTPPTRKRQKKADSRVAELERKIDALTATLHAQKSGTPEVRHLGGIPQHESNMPTGTLSMPEGSFRLGTLSHDWGNNAPRAPGLYPDPPPGYGPAQAFQRSPESQQGPEAKRRKLTPTNMHATITEDMDAIHRDLADNPEMKRIGKNRPQADHQHINPLIDRLMSPDIAERVFLRYVNEICPHFPAVPFPPGTTAREVREKKPLLFLSILAGSSHGSAEQLVSPDAQRELTKLLKDQLADIIWRNGEKSIEIVQTLQIAVLWYRPPLHFEQHNFYMMVNCAAVMALDLGLGRKATPNVMKLSIGPFRRYHPNSSSIEARRTFVVCYYLCMSITMVLRRPILLRWTKYMEESVNMLETSPEAFPSDKLLCQQVKMAHLGEKISVQFSMDDPSVETTVSEPKTVYALKVLATDLEKLKEENSKLGDVDPTLRLAEHVTNLYLHEVALHQNQGSADLQPPFLQEPTEAGKKSEISIGPNHVSALGECLTATHGILDTILSIHLDVLLTLPVIFCVRAIYAIVCLMKMWVSVTSYVDVGNIITKEDLEIETYTQQLVTMFNAIVSRDAQSPHGKFYFVAKRLQERFAQIKEGTTKNETGDSAQEARRSSTENQSTTRRPTRQSSANQTPLHLLSEVASNSPSPLHARSQAQAQAALQAAQQAQQSQSMAPPQSATWYPGVPAHTLESTNFPAGNFDVNFDFTQFDLGTGSDADLSALFIPDAAMWNYATTDPNLQNFNGY